MSEICQCGKVLRHGPNEHRPIQFRMWDEYQGRYIFTGFHVIGEVTCFGMMEDHIRDTWLTRKQAYGYESSLEAWNDFTIEQYTGQRDALGNDIYEGDVIVTMAGDVK